MSVIYEADPLIGDLVEALGFDRNRTRSLTLKIEPRNCVTVQVEEYTTVDRLKALLGLLKTQRIALIPPRK